VVSLLVMNSDVARIDIYVCAINRTLLRENLKLTPGQQLEKFVSFMRFASELRRAGEKTRYAAVA
jgi:hypothetical protein